MCHKKKNKKNPLKFEDYKNCLEKLLIKIVRNSA